MNALWNSAIGLLLVTGGLLGLTLPFGKIATEAGVPAIVWAFVISLGAGGVLLHALLLRGERIRLNAHKLRYFAITAAISYAMPNLLMFSAIPHLGAGYTGIMFTLSPVITLVLSILLGVRRPNLLGVAGIAVGFVGAVMVAATRGEAGAARGAVLGGDRAAHPGLPGRRQHLPHHRLAGRYRADRACRRQPSRRGGDAACRHARRWTGGGSLGASGRHAAAGRSRRWPRRRRCSSSSSGCRRSAGRSISARSAMSAAAVGLISGTLFLGERYELLTWLGAAIIVAGVVMTTKAQSAKA